MPSHGYSDSIHHALAFCAKHHPGPVSRYDGHNPLLTTANIAVILARHHADDATIVAGVLKQLMAACPPPRRAELLQSITLRFGGLVAVAVEAATDPRYDPLGRGRAWTARRFEALARAADGWMASESHVCGMALTDIRRHGVEYARSVAPAPPRDLLWWHGAMLEVLAGRSEDLRSSLLAELRYLTEEVGAYLSGSRGQA